MSEYFITASFQTDNQNKMIEMSKTVSKSENRMNETEKSQIEESESTNGYPFNPVREEPQVNQKSTNCLTKIFKNVRSWINYVNYINIVQTFICAERTDNWYLLPT